MGFNQLFSYIQNTRQILSPVHNLCLEAEITNRELGFSECDKNSTTQKWLWTEATNDIMLRDLGNYGRPLNPSESFV